MQQNTFQEFRNLPTYPSAVARIIGVYFLIYGVGSLSMGLILILDTIGATLPLEIVTILVSIGTVLSFLHNIPARLVPTYVISTGATASQEQTVLLLGGILVIWGIVFLFGARHLLSGRAQYTGRRVTLGILVVWLIYAVLNTLFFSIDFFSSVAGVAAGTALRFNFAQINIFSSVFMLLIPVIFLVILLRDRRLHAYFGFGPYAEAYQNWHSAAYRGETPDRPSPWAGAMHAREGGQRRRAILAVGVMVIIGIVAGGLLLSQNTPEPCPAQRYEIAFTAFDGETFTLSDFEDHVVVINFWGSWCEACRHFSPVLETLWQDYKNQAVVFVGVAYGETETEANARAFIDDLDITYRNALDPGNCLSQAYNVVGAPRTLVLNQGGWPVEFGLKPLSEDELRAIIDELLTAST